VYKLHDLACFAPSTPTISLVPSTIPMNRVPPRVLAKAANRIACERPQRKGRDPEEDKRIRASDRCNRYGFKAFRGCASF
jgi:hypothetical protein